MNATKGFTLIELMIVVAIVGILVTIAIPAYQAYSIRARISEGINLASTAIMAVSETTQTMNTLPANQASTGYVFMVGGTINTADISIADDGTGIITVTTTAVAGGGTLFITPSYTEGQPIIWICSAGSLPVNYLPASCP